MGKERSVYLNSKEQLLIASKVNRLCDIETPEDITPAILEDAKSIIEALDSRIEPASGLQVRGSYISKHNIGSGAAFTGRGQEQVNFEDKKRKDFQMGKINKYRIGGYVAEKISESGNSVLDFVPFWDRGEAEIVLEKPSSVTYLHYKTKSRKLLAIGKLYPTLSKLKPFYVVWHQNDVLWGKCKRGGLKSFGIFF